MKLHYVEEKNIQLKENEVHLAKKNRGMITTDTPLVLDDFIIYMTTIREKSERTAKEYEYDLKLMFKFIKVQKEKMDISEIKTVDISEIDDDFVSKITLFDFYRFLSYCEKSRGNSSYARARKVASIKSFFKYLTNKAKIIQFNPADELETPKIGKRKPIYLTLEETNIFLTGIKNDKHYKRNYCIMMLFLNCAMRISELCSIDISSINGDILTVLGKGNKERTLYLNEISLMTIKDYVENERSLTHNIIDNNALFISQKGTRLNKRTIQKLVKEINVRSGLNKIKMSVHKLRHTSATLLYASGADIRSLQELLGHSSVATTQIYTHIDDKRLRAVVANNPLNIVNKDKM